MCRDVLSWMTRADVESCSRDHILALRLERLWHRLLRLEEISHATSAPQFDAPAFDHESSVQSLRPSFESSHDADNNGQGQRQSRVINLTWPFIAKFCPPYLSRVGGESQSGDQALFAMVKSLLRALICLGRSKR